MPCPREKAMFEQLIPAVLFLAGGVAMIASNATASDAAEPAAPTGAVVQGNDAFALALYAKLRAENKGNVFLSPYSISTALAMTYAGAKGKTAAEMAEVLHFTRSPGATPAGIRRPGGQTARRRQERGLSTSDRQPALGTERLPFPAGVSANDPRRLRGGTGPTRLRRKRRGRSTHDQQLGRREDGARRSRI